MESVSTGKQIDFYKSRISESVVPIVDSDLQQTSSIGTAKAWEDSIVYSNGTAPSMCFTASNLV